MHIRRFNYQMLRTCWLESCRLGDSLLGGFAVPRRCCAVTARNAGLSLLEPGGSGPRCDRTECAARGGRAHTMRAALPPAFALLDRTPKARALGAAASGSDDQERTRSGGGRGEQRSERGHGGGGRPPGARRSEKERERGCAEAIRGAKRGQQSRSGRRESDGSRDRAAARARTLTQKKKRNNTRHSRNTPTPPGKKDAIFGPAFCAWLRRRCGADPRRCCGGSG
jgi:hypothetical protein